ncbi:MAG: sugar phosphate isomerase/epimerase [Actinomycetota bacterium]|nr:sugar phosphate isomerase/epimerase [Actinomycetota bacterium]
MINADWNFWPDGFDRRRIWHTCAQLGFTGMELGVYRSDDELSAPAMSSIEALVAETGLGVEAVLFSMPVDRWPDGGLASAASSQRAVAEIAETARRAAGLGARVLGVWPGADPIPAVGDRAGGWARTVDAVGAVAGVAGPLGLAVAVEYKPAQLVFGAEEALRLVDEIDGAGVGVLVDTAHALAAEEDLATLPDLLGERLVHVHLGDSAGDADADLPPGAEHDFVPFLGALAAARYSGALSFDLYGSVQAGLTTGAEASEQGLAYIQGALATAMA